MKNAEDHYNTLAQKFNELWQFSSDYKEFVVARIKYLLDLSSKDVFVDIGGGTGTFTERLYKEVPLCKAYCIEPSHEMSAKASEIEGLDALCTDADGFISLQLHYSKVLFKEVVHHLQERALLWKNLYNQLPHGGKILIITRPQEVKFPFWQEAKLAFKANQPSSDLLHQELVESGFHVDVDYGLHTFELSKEEWYVMLRHRFMSDLAPFSDDEIECGIREIETICTEPMLQMNDHLIFITASKL